MQLNTNAISHDFSQKSEFQKITSKTTKVKFKKKKRDFPTLLVVRDQESLVRTREQTKIIFLLHSVVTKCQLIAFCPK